MYKRLNRGWRVIATGASFMVFGIGGVVLTLTVLPVMHVLIRDRGARKRRTQRLLSSACAGFIRFMRYSGVVDYDVSGLQHLRTPGALIVANHPSLIDVIFLIAHMPEVDCVVKQRLWHNPVTGGPVRQAGYISNAQAPELLDSCRASLQAGNRLIIFPEGTRTRPGQKLRLQRGAANIALHAGADVVPVTIIAREPTLAKGQPWYHVPSQKIYLSISVDPPIATQAYLDEYGNIPRAVRRLTADLHDYYTARLAAAGRLPENDASI